MLSTCIIVYYQFHISTCDTEDREKMKKKIKKIIQE